MGFFGSKGLGQGLEQKDRKHHLDPAIFGMILAYRSIHMICLYYANKMKYDFCYKPKVDEST